MARYITAVCKLCRRCQEKLMLKGERCSTKCTLDRRRSPRRRRRVSDRALQLMEKQKARYTYGVLERQFRKIFTSAERQFGITGQNLEVLLERRLDNVVYRLGFADSRAQARQLVQHGHLSVNGRKTDIPSYLIREGDNISWRESSAKTEYYRQLAESIESKLIANWLSLDRKKMVGRVLSLPTPDDIGAKFNEKAIVEYYSR